MVLGWDAQLVCRHPLFRYLRNQQDRNILVQVRDRRRPLLTCYWRSIPVDSCVSRVLLTGFLCVNVCDMNVIAAVHFHSTLYEVPRISLVCLLGLWWTVAKPMLSEQQCEPKRRETFIASPGISLEPTRTLRSIDHAPPLFLIPMIPRRIGSANGEDIHSAGRKNCLFSSSFSVTVVTSDITDHETQHHLRDCLETSNICTRLAPRL